MRKALDGLVLRVVQSGENDRRLLVLNADEGKMWVCAKGARSVRSKYASLCRIFTYINFEYYEKKDARWLSAGSVNYPFGKLVSDILDCSLACYILQLADELSGEDAPAHEILRLTLNTLYALEQKLKPREQIKAAYELYAVKDSGMLPELELCPCCQRSEFSPDEMLWLDVMNGHIICSECQTKRGGTALAETDRFDTRNILLPLDGAALCAMRYVAQSSPKKLFSFSIAHERSLDMFIRACESYILNHLERDFDTLTFYYTMKEQHEHK